MHGSQSYEPLGQLMHLLAQAGAHKWERQRGTLVVLYYEYSGREPYRFARVVDDTPDQCLAAELSRTYVLYVGDDTIMLPSGREATFYELEGIPDNLEEASKIDPDTTAQVREVDLGNVTIDEVDQLFHNIRATEPDGWHPQDLMLLFGSSATFRPGEIFRVWVSANAAAETSASFIKLPGVRWAVIMNKYFKKKKYFTTNAVAIVEDPSALLVVCNQAGTLAVPSAVVPSVEELAFLRAAGYLTEGHDNPVSQMLLS